MPLLERDDGVEIHWEARGDGPSVVLAAYWSGHPAVYAALLEDLAADHRVVTYDARGTGGSTRRGPHDMETGSGDLQAVVEESGGPALIVATADGANRAARVAARRPEHVIGVVCLGTAPFSRDLMKGTDAMVASDTVVDAFLDMVERDYRGALRSLLSATNPQMSEGELRDRVAFQADYCPHEVAAARLRSWADDDPIEAARETGDRLWVLASGDVAGAWLPPTEQARARIRDAVPDAHLEEIEDGAVSRPDLTAAVVRQLTQPLREGTIADAAPDPS